jgi:hypothetical protein
VKPSLATYAMRMSSHLQGTCWKCSLQLCKIVRLGMLNDDSDMGLGMALNLAMRVCAWVQVPVCPEPPLVFSRELLGGLRTGFLVVSPLPIACVFPHVERGRSSKHVWRSHRIVYFLYRKSSSVMLQVYRTLMWLLLLCSQKATAPVSLHSLNYGRCLTCA